MKTVSKIKFKTNPIKINTLKQNVYGKGKKASKPKTQKQSEDDDYHKPKRFGNFWNNNYIEHESNGERNKNLPLDEYLDKIRHCLSNIIIDLQESNTWKIQLTIAVNFISWKDAEEKRVIYSKSKGMKLMSYNDAFKVVSELFVSLR